MIDLRTLVVTIATTTIEAEAVTDEAFRTIIQVTTQGSDVDRFPQSDRTTINRPLYACVNFFLVILTLLLSGNVTKF